MNDELVQSMSVQNNAALLRKLNKSASFSTAATAEDWSCDGSATVRSKVSASSGGTSTPRRRSMISMSLAPSSKSIEANMTSTGIVGDLPELASDDVKNDSFTFDDGSVWWGNSPAKTDAKTSTQGPLENIFVSNDCEIENLVPIELMSPSKRQQIESDFVDLKDNQWWKTSPCKQTKKDHLSNETFDEFSRSCDFLDAGNGAESRRAAFRSSGPVGPPLEIDDDGFDTADEAMTSFSGLSSRAESLSLSESDPLFDLESNEAMSPSKPRERRKKTKRISVTKIKAPSQFVNENGEVITDQLEMQEAIKQWNAEQKKKLSASTTRRSSVCAPGSPRKESTRIRRSSLRGSGDEGHGSPRRARSKSKSRSVSEDSLTMSRTRSHSKSRLECELEFSRVRSKSSSRSMSDASNESRVRSSSKARPENEERSEDKERRRGRSKSMARRKSVERAPSQSRPASVEYEECETESEPRGDISLARHASSRGRSVPQRKPDGSERKRTSSLARGLTKITKKSSLGDSIGHLEEKSLTSADDSATRFSLADKSTSSNRSSIEPSRRRSTSLARVLKANPKGESSSKDGARSVISEESANSRRRSKSVGVGLRATNDDGAQVAVARKRVPVARNNSSNITKRRSISNRREDEFMKFAQLSIQSDDCFFTELEEMDKEQRAQEGKATTASDFMKAGHASSPCLFSNF